MRIHSAFLIGFAAVAAPGCGASLWICAKALGAWTEARDAERATRVVMDAQAAHTAFIVEMGQIATAILGSDLDLRQLPGSRAATDRALEQALGSASGDAGDERGILDAMAAARTVRERTAPLLAQPLPVRSRDTVGWVIATRGEHGNRLTAIANHAAMRISASSWLTAGLVHAGMQVMDLRELVGQRNLVMNSWVGGQAIQPGQIVDVDQLTGRIEQAWTNTTRIIDALPPVEAVRAEERREDETYHGRDEKRWLGIVATARARLAGGGDRPAWPESLEGFRAWTQAAKENILRLCAVSMREALAVATGEADAARRQFALAALLAAAAFGSSLVALVHLLGRVVRPIVELTGAIGRIARHDFDVALPAGSNLAEIAEMARAVEGLRRDAIAGERSKRQISEMARHDALTGLPNRRLFAAELEAALGGAERGDAGFALLLADLDGFKPVNDLHGHAAGDLVLCEVARRLQGLAGPECLVARLGGDEFALLVPTPAGAGADAAAALAAGVVRGVADPIAVQNAAVLIGASVGVALCPGDGRDADALLRAADLAMYEAKRDGRGTFRFFRPEMGEAFRRRAALEGDLRRALAEGGVVPHYQPVVALADRAVVSLEVLARWRHPVFGAVPPEQFVPLAERLGLIDELTTALLRQACRDARPWGDGVRLAVNVTPAQIQDHALPVRLLAVLAAEGFPPSRLALEVTESALLGDVGAAEACLGALRSLGVAVALDDFGVGCSNLGHLRELCFDAIKIDRSFVSSMRSDAESGKIVDALLALAASLGLPAVAEGIEDEGTAADLAARGCRYGQGYHFGRAVPAGEVPALLRGLAERASAAAA